MSVAAVCGDPYGEASTRFACYGGDCAVLVSGPGAAGTVALARRRMLEWHERFSRFRADSELSRLNRDPRSDVPVSAVMIRLVSAALVAARDSDGLVDPTLLPELRRAGYTRSRCHAADAAGPVRLGALLRAAPPRRPAAPAPSARWRSIEVDHRARTIRRPPGLELDLGGVAKGVFGDILAGALGVHDAWAVDAAGDVRFGGRHTGPRAVQVGAVDGGGRILHTFSLMRGAAATSGIGRRAFRGPADAPAHHLIDPASGRPAFTGLVQVTALAATGAVAEMRAKAALLAGPRHAEIWLPEGGAIVAEDGTMSVLPAAETLNGEPPEPPKAVAA